MSSSIGRGGNLRSSRLLALFPTMILLSAAAVHAAPEPAAPPADGDSYFSSYPPGFPTEPDQPNGSAILPHGRPFSSLPTDPRDLKLGFRKTSRAKVEADVGGYRSIYGWKGEVSGKSLVFHTGIEGNAYFTMRKEG